ncbi:hypothetical protein IMCC9480_2574 [Oxalobacteraceae bacterium IMCC9480]|nr:hypothetical protein IMCC9480_2574 [Oxalobacteraceae bacterium IMCC9480]
MSSVSMNTIAFCKGDIENVMGKMMASQINDLAFGAIELDE